MTTFHIVTIFPESFDSYLKEGIIGRAIKLKRIKVKFYNPRDFTKDKHRQVDDKPYGGGPGMVMKVEPILKAVDKARRGIKNTKIIILSPRGKQFDNNKAIRLAKQYKNIILICGRYEGIDDRVRKILRAEEISIGPYTLTGGELPATVLLDVVARQISGVLGREESLEEKRLTSGKTYTRPEIMSYKGKKYKVPKVLLSGHHQDIANWRGK